MSDNSSNDSYIDYAVSTTDSNGDKIRPGEDGTLYMDTKLKKEELATIERSLGDLSASTSENSFDENSNDNVNDEVVDNSYADNKTNDGADDNSDSDADDNSDSDADDNSDSYADADSVGDFNNNENNDKNSYSDTDEKKIEYKEEVSDEDKEVSNLTKKNLLENSISNPMLKQSRSSASLSCATTREGTNSSNSISGFSMKRSSSIILDKEDNRGEWGQFKSIENYSKRKK